LKRRVAVCGPCTAIGRRKRIFSLTPQAWSTFADDPLIIE
jgi:hypothetical protein